jgi:uncharacterized protein (DUF58 family)
VGRLFPGDAAAAEVASDLPRILVPGFQLWLSVCLRFHECPPLRLALPLRPGARRDSLEFRAPSRGLYRTETVSLVARDVLGFTRLETVVPLSEQLRVWPSVAPRELSIPHGNGGEVPLTRRDRRPSEELLEVRKYYPGDDPRRVHWKLFAHVQELFLRMGEQSPPPEFRFLAILDLSPPPWLPRSVSSELLDGLIEACASGLFGLLSSGFQAQLAVTDRQRVVPATLERADRLLALCAELWWDPRLELRLPHSGRRDVLLYSVPGSPLQDALLKACASRGWDVHLFLKELPAARGAPWTLGRVFLRDPDTAPVRLGPSGETRRRNTELRRRYRQSLEESAARLGRRRSVHVARV